MSRRDSHPDEHVMSLGDHLEELRTRLLLALAAPLPLFIVFYLVSDTLLRWLVRPVFAVLSSHGLPLEVQALGPPDVLMIQLKLAAITAVVVSAPWILYQLWRFVAPGLYRNEQRFVRLLLPGSALLTAGGVVVLQYVMLPLMLHVLVMIGADVDIDVPVPRSDQLDAAHAVLAEQPAIAVLTAAPTEPTAGTAWLRVPDMVLEVAIADGDAVQVVAVPKTPTPRIGQVFSLDRVVNFNLVLLLGTVVAFQMPLVILLLGWVGIASPDWLASHRRYALGVCGVLGAVLTPADAASMLIMMVPLYGLYELGILLLRLAPAQRVREGTLLRRGRGRPAADKPAPASEHVVKPVQTAGSVPRGAADREPEDSRSDEEAAR